MELAIAQRLAGELGITIESVVREYWELAVLRVLLNTPAGERLVFKGGTALRLAYGSPRFSDDLDFSLTETLGFRTFETSIRRLLTAYPELELTDLAEKRWTFLAEFRVRDAALARPFHQVIEAGRRSPGSEANELRLLSSPCSPLKVLARVATAEAIWNDKLDALAERRATRDLFDLWFLAQETGRSLPAELPRFDLRVLRRDLRKYLPKSYYPVVEELAK